MGKKRNEIVDILKGIAIVTVILVHVFRGKGELDILIGEISRWAVPCFFMIQGFYMKNTSRKTWISNFINKMTKVYLPFLLFSVTYGLYFWKFRGITFTVADVFWGKTAIHLYFIIHYMIFATFIPILYKLKENIRIHFTWFMIISNFLICLAYEIQKYHGIKLIFYNGFNPGKYWGFVAIGMLVSERESILNYIKRNRTEAIILSIVVTVIGILVPFLTNTVGYMYNKSSLFPLSLGMTSLIISYFYESKVKYKYMLSYIGQRSFGIYLVHIFIIHFLKSILGFKSLWTTSILTLVTSILLINISKTLFAQITISVGERGKKHNEKEINL